MFASRSGNAQLPCIIAMSVHIDDKIAGNANIAMGITLINDYIYLQLDSYDKNLCTERIEC